MTSTKKKIIATYVTLAITILSFCCGTLAYFTDSTSSHGHIATGSASVEVVDITYPYGSSIAVPPGTAIRIMPGYEIEKTMSVRNTGSLPLYIRIKLNSDITLAENARGNEADIDLSLVGYDINLTDWVEHDGYYYYRTHLSGGKEAAPLFTKVIFSEEMGNIYKDSTITFDARVEVVQANNNADNPIYAYGWDEAPGQGGGE